MGVGAGRLAIGLLVRARGQPPDVVARRPDGGRCAALARHDDPAPWWALSCCWASGSRGRCPWPSRWPGRCAEAGSAVSVVTTFGYGGFLWARRSWAASRRCGPQDRPRDHSRGRGRRLRALLAPAGTKGGGATEGGVGLPNLRRARGFHGRTARRSLADDLPRIMRLPPTGLRGREQRLLQGIGCRRTARRTYPDAAFQPTAPARRPARRV